jgi:hypothetical protein
MPRGGQQRAFEEGRVVDRRRVKEEGEGRQAGDPGAGQQPPQPAEDEHPHRGVDEHPDQVETAVDPDDQRPIADGGPEPRERRPERVQERRLDVEDEQSLARALAQVEERHRLHHVLGGVLLEVRAFDCHREGAGLQAAHEQQPTHEHRDRRPVRGESGVGGAPMAQVRVVDHGRIVL